MEEDPDKEEQTTTALVNHPNIPPIDESLGLVWPPGRRTSGVGSLKRLQTPPLGLVSLKVTRFGSTVGKILPEVRVLIQIGSLSAVGEVEARRSFQLAKVRGHGEL